MDLKMLSYLAVFVLVSGLVAAKPGPGELEPKPCCAPRYFTLTQTTFVTTVEEGNLKVEQITAEIAYDSVSEQFALKIKEKFFNGTDRYFMVIFDYEEEKEYYIVKNGEEESCHVLKTKGEFPKECLPEHAKFVSETTLGDHDLVVDNWYYANEEGDTHVLQTVQREGCVPVGLFARKFDKETEKEVEVTDARIFDFSLGICDREKYFKPPASCQEGRALAKPTPKMLEMKRKVRFI